MFSGILPPPPPVFGGMGTVVPSSIASKPYFSVRILLCNWEKDLTGSWVAMECAECVMSSEAPLEL